MPLPASHRARLAASSDLESRLQYADENKHIADAEYWRLVAAGWVWCESLPDEGCDLDWRQLFCSKRRRRSALMTNEELADLADLPDPLRVFRGFAGLSGQAGLSWTLERAVAERIARERHALPPTPQIAEGLIRKRDVIAYFADRGEREIIALPESVGAVACFSVGKGA